MWLVWPIHLCVDSNSTSNSTLALRSSCHFMNASENTVFTLPYLLLILFPNIRVNQSRFITMVGWEICGEKREERGDVPVVIPKWSIAAMGPNFELHIWLIVIGKRQTPPPTYHLARMLSELSDLLSGHLKIMVLSLYFQQFSPERKRYTYSGDNKSVVTVSKSRTVLVVSFNKDQERHDLPRGSITRLAVHWWSHPVSLLFVIAAIRYPGVWHSFVLSHSWLPSPLSSSAPPIPLEWLEGWRFCVTLIIAVLSQSPPFIREEKKENWFDASYWYAEFQLECKHKLCWPRLIYNPSPTTTK